MMKAIRLLDCTFSLLGIIVLAPFFVLVSVAIKTSSKGSIFFRQSRIGINGIPFTLYKFRTMETGAQEKSLLTVGERDNRITAIGFYLRKFKLDELPQLWNVLKGDMSVVGPRPEVKKYVDLYTPDQKIVLSVKPGITDLASIVYRNENELLANAQDPEDYYITEIMPGKIELNKKFIRNQHVKTYLHIILRTIITAAKGR